MAKKLNNMFFGSVILLSLIGCKANGFSYKKWREDKMGKVEGYRQQSVDILCNRIDSGKRVSINHLGVPNRYKVENGVKKYTYFYSCTYDENGKLISTCLLEIRKKGKKYTYWGDCN